MEGALGAICNEADEKLDVIVDDDGDDDEAGALVEADTGALEKKEIGKVNGVKTTANGDKELDA